MYKSEYEQTTCRRFPEGVFKFFCLLPGNDKCGDCGNHKHIVYRCVTYGTLLCRDCAFCHITKPSHIKGKGKVISIQDGKWTLPDILSMEEGGNQAVIDYVQQQEKPQVKKQRRSTMDNRPMRRGSLLQSIDASIGRKRNSL